MSVIFKPSMNGFDALIDGKVLCHINQQSGCFAHPATFFDYLGVTHIEFYEIANKLKEVKPNAEFTEKTVKFKDKGNKEIDVYVNNQRFGRITPATGFITHPSFFNDYIELNYIDLKLIAQRIKDVVGIP